MANQNSRSLLLLTLGALLGIVIAGAGAIGGYYLYETFNEPELAFQNPESSDSGPKVKTPVATETDNDELIKDEMPATETPVTSPSTSSAIVWQAPKQVTSLRVFGDEDLGGRELNTKYYVVGIVETGQYKNYDVIAMHYPAMGPAFYPLQAYLLRSGQKLVFLSYDSDYHQIEELKNPPFVMDDSYRLPDLQFPKTLSGPKPRQNLVLDNDVREIFTADVLTKIFTDSVWGDVYTTNFNTRSVIDRNPDLAVFGKEAFYLKAPDGTARVYKWEPDFFVDFLLPQFTWNDGKKNEQQYNYTDRGGCGSTNYISVIEPGKIDPATDLVIVAKSSRGDDLYEFKNKNHPMLKDFYDTQYVVYTQTGEPGSKKPYEEFVSAHPLLFFYDPFGRLIKMHSTEFLPQAECGKPVIYLYPEKTTEVSVKLRPTGGFTYTEPKYIDGWKVLAEPNGQLTEISTGKIYPYLFWEGHGGIYQPTNKGFMVKKENVHQFLVEKLAWLGLNEQESRDFMEFWEPKMTGSPYFFVTFFGRSVMDAIAPLNVSPKPDTVIRILMDFKGLEKPIKVEDYKIVTPERKGFTVVEWGGVLR